jgi:membrane protein YqaA with SNARE-associated domain
VTTAALICVIAAKSKAWDWLYRLGAAGFFPLGIADNSVIPTPGSMDALLIVLIARNREWWWFYALMATGGSLLGAYLNYRVFQKGGEEALEKRIGHKGADKARKYFERYGALSLVFGAVAPPPMPAGPFIAVAAVMEYPKLKFLGAFGAGRFVRFGVVAWIVHKYGRHIFSFFSKYYKPALWTLVTLAVVGGIAGAIYYLRWKKKKRQQGEVPAGQPHHRAA